jgi:hypothetical protein
VGIQTLRENVLVVVRSLLYDHVDVISVLTVNDRYHRFAYSEGCVIALLQSGEGT